MKRFYCFLLLGLLSLPGVTQAAPQKPNILWLIAEDFGQHLGCYGAKEVWTPHLDRLATEGVLYTHLFNGHVCSPSRSAFNTGMYATTLGAHNHRTRDKQPLPEGVKVLSDWMRQAGFFTANLKELPASCGFKGTGKTDWNFQYEGKPFDTDQWSELKSRQPFYAQLNFSETHRAYRAPKKADPSKVEIPPYYPEHPITREDWAQSSIPSATCSRNCTGRAGSLQRKTSSANPRCPRRNFTTCKRILGKSTTSRRPPSPSTRRN